MWPTLKRDAKTTSPPINDTRPWTPPDTDSKYLDDPFGPDSPANQDARKTHRAPNARLEDSGYVGGEQDNIPQYAHYTDAHSHLQLRTPDPPDGLQYPYTPDSTRMPTYLIQQSPPLYPIPPLPPMPWDQPDPLSPVQTALSSCISHLEGLIQIRQPTDEQMDLLIAKFEEMTQCLSAPEPQSRQSDDHLFSELELPVGLAGTLPNDKPTNVLLEEGDPTLEAATAAAYLREVSRYIADVSRYTGYLKTRLDETKRLNNISADVIDNLRFLLREQYWELDEYKNRASAEGGKSGDRPATRPARTKPKPKQQQQQQGFWASVGYALDTVSDMWLES